MAGWKLMTRRHLVTRGHLVSWRHLMPTRHLVSTRHAVLRLRATVALRHLSLGHPRAHWPLAWAHGRHPTHWHSYRTIGTHRHLWSHLTLHTPWTRHTTRTRHAPWKLLAPSHISSGHVWCHACRRSTALLTALLGHPRAAIGLHSAHVGHVSSSRCSATSFGVWAVGTLLLHGGFGVGRPTLGGGWHLTTHARCSRALPTLWHGIVASTAVHVHAGAWAGASHHTHWHHVGPHVGHLTWHLHPLTNGSLMPHHGP